MRMIGWKSIGLGLVAGGACAVALYTSMGVGVAPVSSTLPVSVPAAAASPSTAYLDCVPPAQLEGDECVTRVTEKVVVPAPAARPAAAVADPAAPAPAPAAGPVSAPERHDDAEEHEHEHDEDEHDGGEHDDD